LYNDSRKEASLSSGIKYQAIQKGCSPCAKKRGIDPKTLEVLVFDTFVEVDSEGNIFESELA
jgi:hypothetical protein